MGWGYCEPGWRGGDLLRFPVGEGFKHIGQFAFWRHSGYAKTVFLHGHFDARHDEFNDAILYLHKSNGAREWQFAFQWNPVAVHFHVANYSRFENEETQERQREEGVLGG